MFKVVEIAKALISKGFASAAEKAELKTMFEALGADEQKIVAKEVEPVEDLPEEAAEEEDEEGVEEVKSLIKKYVKNETTETREKLLEEVQKYMDEQAEKKAKKAGIYAADVDADKAAARKALSNKMRHGIKFLLGDTYDAGLVKEMTTDSSGSPYAGYVTDDQLSAEIRHLTTEYGVSAREMTTVSFREKSYKANNLATDVSTYWVDEAGSISSTQAVLGQSTLELKKLAAIVTLTRELMQESEIDFVSFLGSRVAESFAQKEDEAFFKGDGTSTYGSFTGLLNNTSVNTVTMSTSTFASVTVEDLRSMQDSTPQGAHANAKYYMNRTILTIIRNLREDAVSAGDGAGAFLYKAPSGGDPANIDGYPIVLVEAMPTASNTAADTPFILFGDLKKACIRGVRGGIIADRFNAGTVRNVADSADINLITTDREAVRWINQVGFIVILPSAVTRLKTAAASA